MPPPQPPETPPRQTNMSYNTHESLPTENLLKYFFRVDPLSLAPNSLYFKRRAETESHQLPLAHATSRTLVRIFITILVQNGIDDAATAVLTLAPIVAAASSSSDTPLSSFRSGADDSTMVHQDHNPPPTLQQLQLQPPVPQCI
ncbi:hypothetical protein F5879DRAFT_1004499 [Lentinula edodes]|nr:hypothetical protein F5879DRAFT_1004499 [Lentinula edodes]